MINISYFKYNLYCKLTLSFHTFPNRIYIKKKPIYHPPAYKPSEPYKQPSYGQESSGDYAKAAASSKIEMAVKPDTKHEVAKNQAA